MKNKKIPLKNYILVFVILLLVVSLSLYACSWYETIRKYNTTKSVLSDTINKIELETLESYMTDNSDFIMYISDSSNTDIRNFEKKLKKYIKDNSLNSDIIYIDINDYDRKQVLQTVLSYSVEEYSKLKKIPVPNMLMFENGKIVDILYVTSATINRNDAVKFIEKGNL